MATNASNSAKTIKDMMLTIDNDVWEIDNFIYYTKFSNDLEVSISNILQDYYDYFESVLETTEVPKKFYYQPAAFAENYYGTPDLDFLVLYFAKMDSLFEFTKPTIKVLPRTKLIELNKLMVSKKDSVEKSYNSPDEVLEETPLEINEKSYYVDRKVSYINNQKVQN